MGEENFRKTIRFAYTHSKFYQKKFKECSISVYRIKGPEDLGDFFTTAEDLRENLQDFVCLRADTAYETTGTTSKKPKRVYFSRNEIKEAGWAGAVGLWGLGVRPEDRVASAFSNSFWVSGPVLQTSCETLGCFHVEAGHIPPAEFYDRVADYGITVIVGDPSWLLRLAEIAKEKGTWPIKLMIGGGENLTEEARHTIEKIWNTDLFLGYGQTEAFGAIGMEFKDKAGYYLNEFHNYFEIINPNADGYGELVYTTLNRRVMPLIRYRSGDITRFIHTPNLAHKLPGQRIEKLKGRIDEWTVTAMGNIAPWMFESIFKKTPGIGEDWQIVVEKEGNKDAIFFNMEHENGAKTDVNEVIANFKLECPEAWRIYEMGILKIDFKFHPKGTLRTERKLRRIVDKRKF